MKGSRKIAEAAKVVEICKKIKQDYPNFELQAWHLNIDTEASQKLEQIKYDYQCYVQLYNKLHKQKLINDYFATEEGKALKLQMKEYIEEAKKNKKKIYREYQKIFSSIVKTEFGKDFGLDKECYDLKIAHKDTIQYLKDRKSMMESSKFHTPFCFGKTIYEHPFIEIRFFKEEIIVETFGFEFIDLLKNKGWQIIQQKQTKLSLDQAKELYKMHKDEDFYNDLCEYMSSGECICCSCYKDCKDPFKEMKTIKDSVRNKWGKSEMKNAMHSSDSLENVNRETKIVFN